MKYWIKVDMKNNEAGVYYYPDLSIPPLPLTSIHLLPDTQVSIFKIQILFVIKFMSLICLKGFQDLP